MIKRTVLFIFIMWLVSCHERNNIFDVGADDFIPPPHITQLFLNRLYYDTQDSMLIGIRFLLPCTEAFEKTLPITHRLYYSDTVMLVEHTEDVPLGTWAFYVEIFGPYEVGMYSLRHYFGGLPIGAGFFGVIEGADGLTVEGVDVHEYRSWSGQDWSCTVYY
jgi:hypothetical protein